MRSDKVGVRLQGLETEAETGVRGWQTVEPHIGKAEWGEAESGGREGGRTKLGSARE